MRDVSNHRLGSRVINRFLTVVVFAIACASMSEVKAAWDEKDFNPKPLADDLIVPMPCDGAMAFRPVAVVTDKQIEDARIFLGHSDEKYAFQEGSWETHIAGAFTDKSEPKRRVYYLAKYELTLLQRMALGGECIEKPSVKHRFPASGLTWTAAITLADTYSSWLLKNANKTIPREDGVPGFVRLPTEAEWEFAARGGLKVSRTEFQDRIFPMPDGELRDYAWFSGTTSSQGKPKPVGLKKANPLGLHDMLGNLEEIVLDPFHINRLGRLHGQPGGYMVKGGHFLTSQESIRTSYRQEVPHYDDRGPRAGETVGVRFAISAPVLTSALRLKSLQEQWQGLASAKGGSPVSDRAGAMVNLGQSRADPMEEIAVLRDAVSDPQIKDRLNGLSLVIKANIAARDTERSRAIRSFLRQGAFVSDQLLQAVRVTQQLEKSVKTMESAGAKADTLKRIYQNIESHEKTLTYNLEYYSDLVIMVADDYTDADLKTQREVIKAELSEKKLTSLDQLVGVFFEHVSDYHKSKRIEQKKIRQYFEQLTLR